MIPVEIYEIIFYNKTYASNISSKTDWIVMKKDFMSRNQINLSQWKDFHWFYLFWILGSVASAVIPTLLVVMTNGFDWSSLIQDGECYLFLFGITIPCICELLSTRKIKEKDINKIKSYIMILIYFIVIEVGFYFCIRNGVITKVDSIYLFVLLLLLDLLLIDNCIRIVYDAKLMLDGEN